MTNRLIFLILILLSILLSSCCEDKIIYENKNDPASSNYIPPIIFIDNFNNGDSLNFFGFSYKIFNDSAKIDVSLINDPENVLCGTGYSVKIEFDVSDPTATPSCGWVEPLVKIGTGGVSEKGYDLAALDVKYLTFWIKRQSEGINFELALRDIKENQTSPKKLLTDYISPATNWQKIIIPISDLIVAENNDPVNLSILKEFNIGFSKERFQKDGGDLNGIFYIDEIGFERYKN